MKRIVWVNPASIIKSLRDLMSGPFRRENVNAFSRLKRVWDKSLGKRNIFLPLSRWSLPLPIILISIGIVLRLNHYLGNRSFWLDEAWLALDITLKSIQEILFLNVRHIDLPSAPMGFLLVEKISILAFGNTDYALRLFPLLCGILSLFLFYAILKRYCSRPVVIMALGLFALIDPLVYYSAELKQYSSDVMIALIMYLLADYYVQSRNLKIYGAISFGFVGAYAICFSHSSVFVLAGIGLTLISFSIVRRQWDRIPRLLIAFYFWFLALATLYFFSFKGMLENEFIWENAHKSINLMPYPFWTQGIKWIGISLVRILKNLIGTFPLTLMIGVCAFLLGLQKILKDNKERFFMLITPVLFALIAAGLRIYPFGVRFSLFAVPAILIFVSEGVCFFLKKRGRQYKVIGVITIILLFFYPLTRAGHYLIHPRGMEEIKPVMLYLKKHQREGDRIFLNNSAQYAFAYYLGYYKLPYFFNPVVKIWDGYQDGPGYNFLIAYENYIYDQEGNFDGISKRRRGPIKLYKGKFDRVFNNYKRTWVLFSHADLKAKKIFLESLDKIGKRLTEVQAEGVSLYLYDLTQILH